MSDPLEFQTISTESDLRMGQYTSCSLLYSS